MLPTEEVARLHFREIYRGLGVMTVYVELGTSQRKSRLLGSNRRTLLVMRNLERFRWINLAGKGSDGEYKIYTYLVIL